MGRRCRASKDVGVNHLYRVSGLQSIAANTRQLSSDFPSAESEDELFRKLSTLWMEPWREVQEQHRITRA